MGWTILKSFFQDKTTVNIGGILEGLDVFSIIDTLAKQCNLKVSEKDLKIILEDENNTFNDFDSIKEYLSKFSKSVTHKKLLLFIEIFNDLE